MKSDIIRLSACPEKTEQMAAWFAEKWGYPRDVYLESMEAAVRREGAVPEWYAAVDDGRIVGGLGVIENDFHERKDLAPNVCAVYTEPDCRGQGIAGALLARVAEDMKNEGIPTLYLLTNHENFYERYGWRFFTLAQGDGEETPARLYVKTTE